MIKPEKPQCILYFKMLLKYKTFSEEMEIDQEKIVEKRVNQSSQNL